jgi:hypothetical protein
MGATALAPHAVRMAEPSGLPTLEGDRGGTRTFDQRISLPHRLSLTRLYGKDFGHRLCASSLSTAPTTTSMLMREPTARA